MRAGRLSLCGVDTDRPAPIHSGTGSGGFGWVKGGDGAVYVMPEMASDIKTYELR